MAKKTREIREKRIYKNINGVLLLDKAIGESSNFALQRVRHLLEAKKAGHTGTLDPLATGLLPLCFGEATKFSADLLNANKSYEATVLFGQNTNTGDSEGEIIKTREVTFSEADLLAVLLQFIGKISQIPPMYSALKFEGKNLYELARKGIEIERAPREVLIHQLQLLEFDATNKTARLFVRCSKGTYIRTLAEDIGEVLNAGAHLIALRRTSVGDLSIQNAITFADLEKMPVEERANSIFPVDSLLKSLANIHLNGEETLRFAHGNFVVLKENLAEGNYRVYANETHQLLGIGQIRQEEKQNQKSLFPQRLIAYAPEN